MKTSLTLTLAFTTIAATGACSDEKWPIQEAAANDDTSALPYIPHNYEPTPLQKFDCAALLSVKDVQEVCGDPTMRLLRPDFMDNEKNTSNIPCDRSYAGKGKSSGWTMLGHSKAAYALDMQQFNLDYAKEEGDPTKMLQGLGPIAYSDSDTEVLHKTYVHFSYQNFNVVTSSPNNKDCSLGLARLLNKRLNAL